MDPAAGGHQEAQPTEQQAVGPQRQRPAADAATAEQQSPAHAPEPEQMPEKNPTTSAQISTSTPSTHSPPGSPTAAHTATSTGTRKAPSQWLSPRPWQMAIAGWIGALAACMALLAVLIVYDGRDYLQWSGPPSLNTIVQLLVTVFSVCLGGPVASSFAQLKWNAFTEPRPLIDFQLIGKAGRSPFDNIMLLLQRITKIKQPVITIALYGALVSLYLAAVSILTQPLVGTRLKTNILPNQDNALLPVNHPFSGSNFDVLSLADNQTLYSSVFVGLFSPIREKFYVTPTCVNANCTWDSYFTVAVNGSCQNITGSLAAGPPGQAESFVLPNGHQLIPSAPNGAANYSTINVTTHAESIVFADLGNVLVDFSAIYTPSPQNPAGTTLAYECVLRVIGEQLTSTVEAGVFRETVTNQFFNNTPFAVNASSWRASSGLPSNVNRAADVCIDMDLPEGVTTASADDTPKDRLTACNMGLISNQLVMSLDGLLGNDGLTSVGARSVNNTLARMALGNTTFTINDQVQNVAKLLTSWMRSLRQSDMQLPNQQHGVAQQQELVFHIHWAYFVTPPLLLVLSALLSIFTFVDWRRRGLPIWGDSLIATLTHGTNAALTQRLGGIRDVAVLEQEAESLISKLDGPALEMSSH